MSRGKIRLVNPDLRCGVIEAEGGEVLYFRGACVVRGYTPIVGDRISFRVASSPFTGQREAVQIVPQGKAAA
jgi:hypothetical protein